MEVKSLTQIADENHLAPNALNDMRITALYIGICGVILGVASVWVAFAFYNAINAL